MFFFNILKYRKYRRFDERSAKEWAEKNFKTLTDNLNKEEINVVSEYCKQRNEVINKQLRNNLVQESTQREIDILDRVSQLYQLKEDLIVYRIVSVDIFKESSIYTEQGFLSVSLVDGDINSIHRGKYKLKIFVPKGTYGFYVDFISMRHGEFEFLMPRDIKLRKIRSKHEKDNKIKIDCYIE